MVCYIAVMTDDWTVHGKVRAREGGGTLELIVDNRDNAKKSHVWYIRLTENGQPASEIFRWQSDTIKDCDESYSVQVKEIDFRRSQDFKALKVLKLQRRVLSLFNPSSILSQFFGRSW